MKFDNRVTQMLGVEYPIVQAPMGWIARSALASAVSNAGGLGIIETSSGELDAVKVEIKKMKLKRDKNIEVIKIPLKKFKYEITSKTNKQKGSIIVKQFIWGWQLDHASIQAGTIEIEPCIDPIDAFEKRQKPNNSVISTEK